MLSGAELLGRLRARGDALNDAAQRLAARHPSARRLILDRLHGRTHRWPDVPQPDLRSVKRLWTQCEEDILMYADAISASSKAASSSRRAAYDAADDCKDTGTSVGNADGKGGGRLLRGKSGKY